MKHHLLFKKIKNGALAHRMTGEKAPLVTGLAIQFPVSCDHNIPMVDAIKPIKGMRCCFV